MIALQQEIRRMRASPLARNAGWMVLGQGGSLLLQSIYFLLIARLLGAYDYGVYAGAFALTNIIGQYSSMGSGTLFLRYVSADSRKFPLYWGNILLVTTLASAFIIAALSLFAGRLLRPESHSIVLLGALANCLCFQITGSAAKVFQTYEQLRITAALSLANNLLRTMAAGALLVFLHRVSAGQWSVVIVALSALIAAASVIVVTRKFGQPQFNLGHLRANLAEGFGFSFATSTSTAYNDIDKTMLSHYGMNAANGIYSIAYRIIDVATVPILAVREAAMPRFFRDGLDGIRGSGFLAIALLKRTVPLGLVAMVAVFLAAPVVPYLVGSGFRDTVLALRWLCLIPLFRGIHQMTGSAITGSGLQRYRTLSQVAAVSLNVGLNLWLIPRHGWLGAAWSSLATDGLLAVANSTVLAVIWRLTTKSLGSPQGE